MQSGRAHLIVKGRVQGVFYRAFTRDIATHIGLSGWVRNLSDGSVEALLEGQKDGIEMAIAHFRLGPPGARVDDVNVRWEEYLGDLKGFQIRYY